MLIGREHSLAMGELGRPWARHARERRLELHEAALVVEGHSLVAVGRVEEGIAGPAELGRTAVVAAVTGEDTRDGQGEHHTEPVAEAKARRSIPAAAEEEAGHSPAAGEDSDPAGEGHHEEHPEDRIVVEDTEAVDSPGEDPVEVRPEDNRRARVVLCTRRV